MYISIYMQAAAKAGKAIQKKTKVKATVDKPCKQARTRMHWKSVGDKKVFDAKVLQYRPAVTKPRHYGSVTIYTSGSLKAWRVKPAPGRRDETIFKYSVSPRARWDTLVKLVKSLKQV
jgi:hypothetical protein